jgi:hypothetical protein
VNAEQLCFFSFPKPLLDKFGARFFQGVPKAPGVYLMLDSRQKVIYVGQSQNLRVRLSYYKNARPEREPRKIIRLVHRTEAIHLEQCNSPEAAQLRELELIREHRPKFNVASMLTPTYSFFGWACAEGQLRIRLSLDPAKLDQEQFHGAFKNRGLCRRTNLAIARLLWARKHRAPGIFDVPIEFSLNSRKMIFEVPIEADEYLPSLLQRFFDGVSPSLLEFLQPCVNETSDPFLKRLFEGDLLTLSDFFSNCAERNQQLRTFHGIYGIIPQERLDGLFLLMRKANSKLGSINNRQTRSLQESGGAENHK